MLKSNIYANSKKAISYGFWDQNNILFSKKSEYGLWYIASPDAWCTGSSKKVYRISGELECFVSSKKGRFPLSPFLKKNGKSLGNASFFTNPTYFLACIQPLLYSFTKKGFQHPGMFFQAGVNG